jgi:hypothetical protein
MKPFFRVISPMTGLAVCAASLLLSPVPAAANIVYDFGIVFSGTGPGDPVPWGSATFQDYGVNQVLLTIDNTGLTGTEFYSGIYFNLDPTLVPGDLSFSAPTKTGTFDTPAINLSADGFKSDGDGCFDIQLAFNTSGSDSHRFGVGNAISYVISISGSSPLLASSFYYVSWDGGGAGNFYAAGHLQGVPAGGGSVSAWVAPIPEPGSAALLFLGTCLWAAVRRMTR